ncbi:hypothetical protein [Gloeobacter kilaueensis]|uniref:Uncharacterized protein n=1 Tax=Gloeobacter kilaueensis (strain ATCC BAA-2537 / CCAP 1431/1 / ULC 316 / JS1) TaxID=1183438 RepID=U5QMB9_GLOK1|nr:hypothetical protein [Gloeobacter kilaueensis]AGY60142.1 hypothetical protein GKIL_3896 [Gloeobacter kilaueensis JS1]
MVSVLYFDAATAMISAQSPDRYLQQFIRKNHDLIVKWYQNDHLSWAVIAARLNQCRRGGGITASMLQAALPYLTRNRQPALEVVAENAASSQRATLAALEEHIQKQDDLLRLQSGRVQEIASRWARLEELVNQLVPLVGEARSASERLPRNNPAARQVLESLQQLSAVLHRSTLESLDERDIEALAMAIAGLGPLQAD